MKDALILHGKPTRERYENPELPKPHEANWLPWLASKLGQRGITATVPAFPEPFHPNYENWKQAFEQYPVGRDTGVIAHSAGAEFATRWLSESKDRELAKLVLVAPWTDVSRKYGGFSNYELDAGLAERVGEVVILSSVDDSDAINSRTHFLHEKISPSKYVEFDHYGHFMIGNNMDSEEFQELLEEVVS